VTGNPVDWAGAHMLLLTAGNTCLAKLWIMRVCDKQRDELVSETEEEPDEWSLWNKWQAPKFIHMQPSGNTPYSSSEAWTREDVSKSQRLVPGPSEEEQGK